MDNPVVYGQGPEQAMTLTGLDIDILDDGTMQVTGRIDDYQQARDLYDAMLAENRDAIVRLHVIHADGSETLISNDTTGY